MTSWLNRLSAAYRTSVNSYDEDIESRFINRELSWLDFNDRVLALASHENVPLLERCRFLSICSSNLDEFYQIRVAALKDQVAGEISTRTPDGRSPIEQLQEIKERTQDFVQRQEKYGQIRFSRNLNYSVYVCSVGHNFLTTRKLI